MSPEVIRRSEYNYSTDIWSLGITCIELAEGEPPLSNIRMIKVMQLILKDPPKGLTNPSQWSKEFNDFVKACLTIQPEKRPTAKELQKHPFLLKKNKGIALISELVSSSIEEISNYRKTQYDSEEEEDQGNFESGSVVIKNDNFEKDSSTVINKDTYNFNAGTMVVNNEEEGEENGNDKIVKKVKNKNGGSFVVAEPAKKESEPLFMKYINQMELSYDDYNQNPNMISQQELPQPNNKPNNQKKPQEKEEKNPKGIIKKTYEVQDFNPGKKDSSKNASKKIVIRYPPDEDSNIEVDDMTIGNERDSIVIKVDNKNSKKSNDDALKNFSEKMASNIDNNILSESSYDINELMKDKEVNNCNLDDLHSKITQTNDEMENEIMKIRLKYQEKFNKLLYTQNYLKNNPHLKKLSELEVYAKFSKYIDSTKLVNNSKTMYDESIGGNSIYTLNTIKTNDYKPNNISKINKLAKK